MNVQDHERAKQRIIDFLQRIGPSLPIHVAKTIGVNVLFSSAFLSELMSKKLVVTSNMRIGSSPLYFLPGQESQLEKFSNHLNTRELEAFNLLKEKGVLDDQQVAPVVRVALRAISDFAFPLKYNEKLYWRYFTLSPENAVAMISVSQISIAPKEESEYRKEIFQRRVEAEISPVVVPEVVEVKKEIEVIELPKTEIVEVKKELAEEEKENVVEERIEVEEVKEVKHKDHKEKKEKLNEKSEFVENVSFREPTKTMFSGHGEQSSPVRSVSKKDERSEFVDNVVSKLKHKKFEVIQEIEVKKKEYMAKVKIDSDVGEIIFLAVAKDKKSISDNDLTVALQRAQSEKLPAMVLAFSDLNKKGKEYLAQWGNLVKFVKM